MPSRRAQTTPDIDPLADLRETAPAGLTVAGPPGTITALNVPTVTVLREAEAAPLDQAWHDAARVAIVTRWHDDPVAQRYAHKGGTCGCQHLARLALLEVHGQPQEDPA